MTSWCHTGATSQSCKVTRLIRSREVLVPGTSDSCRPRGVVTRDFWPFSAVCLTVFLFEFRPRTFTIGFCGKKSIISALMILECSFPLSLLIYSVFVCRLTYPFCTFLTQTRGIPLLNAAGGEHVVEIVEIFVPDLISYFRLNVRNLEGYENHARIQVYVTPVHHPWCMKIYSL